MTLEEIMEILETEDINFQLSEAEDDSNEEEVSQEEKSNNEKELENSAPGNEEIDIEAEKLALTDNLNRLIVLKDLLTELCNYKQNEDLMMLLNKVRTLLINIADKIKNEDYESDLHVMNTEMEKLIKMIVVYIKQLINPEFKKKIVEKQQDTETQSELTSSEGL